MEELVAAVVGWVIALVGSPWVFVALYAFAAIDGVLPPIPSESVVIALAALSVSTGEPNFYVLGAVAAAGAFTGDQAAYSIGKRIPVSRLRFMRGPRQQRALRWAEKALSERGASFIIAARYVPVGRVAVNMTAGAVGYSRRRFTGLAVIAAISWSFYSVMLGIGAGVWLGDEPLLAVVVGVASGVLIGVVIDAVLRWISRSRGGRRRLREAAAARSEEADGAGREMAAGEPAPTAPLVRLSDT